MGSKNKKRLVRQAQRNAAEAAAAAAAGVVISGVVGAPDGQGAQIPNAQPTQIPNTPPAQAPNAQPTHTPKVATGSNATQTSGLIPTPSSIPPPTHVSVPISTPAPMPISTLASAPLPAPAPLSAPFSLSPRPPTTSQSSAPGSIASSKPSPSAHHQATTTRNTLPALPLSAGGSTTVRPTASQAPSAPTSAAQGTTELGTTVKLPSKPESEVPATHSFELLLESPKPSAGTKGAGLDLESNHFKCTFNPSARIYQYDVECRPPSNIKSTPRKIRRILRSLLNEKYSRAPVATDYARLIVSLNPLIKKDGTSNYDTVNLFGGDQSRQAQDWTVHWTQLATLDLQELHGHIFHHRTSPLKQEIIKALNLFTSHCLIQSETHSLAGKDRFFPNQPIDCKDLGGGLEACIGFSRSIRPLQSDMFLQLNTSCSAFYHRVTVAELLDQWTTMHGSGFSSGQRKKMQAFIRGLRVRATYDSKRLYSVWGLSVASGNPGCRPTANNVHFNVEKDETVTRVSVKEHFREAYGEKKPRENALVVNVGTDKHVVSIPSDLLQVLPGNVYKHLLNAGQSSIMVGHAVRNPTKTYNAIYDCLESFDTGSIHKFGLQVSGSMVQISGRMLPPPKLQYRERSFDVNDNSLKGRHFYKVNKVPHCAWIELFDSKAAEKDQVSAWVRQLRWGLDEYCSVLGKKPKLLPFKQAQQFPGSNNALQTLLQSAVEDGYDVLFVLLSNQDASNYDRLKLVADFHVGVTTVCTTAAKDWYRDKRNKANRIIPQVKNDKDFIGNEMLKVNLRMGGINRALPTTEGTPLGALLSRSTMIVGADVTHPGPGSMEATQSIAALVASYEETFSQYPASIRCQQGKVEMIQELDEMMTERLETWSRLNPPAADGSEFLPTQIIFFRDGVSEGEFQKVGKEELPLIEKALVKFYGNRDLPCPKLLFICVVKRGNTRFYPTDIESENNPHIDQYLNALPGLVVDTHITYSQGHDFYMQSHRVLKEGTAKPNHYIVIVDQIGVTPDVLQQAIFWQCWTFQRSLMSISVHPAARLADRACTRARSYLRDYLVNGAGNEEKMDREVNAKNAWNQGVHPKLADTMFYI